MGSRYVDDLEKYSSKLERDNADLERDLANVRERLRQADHRNYVFANGICLMAAHVQELEIALRHANYYLRQHDCHEMECGACQTIAEIETLLAKEKTDGQGRAAAQESADT